MSNIDFSQMQTAAQKAAAQLAQARASASLSRREFCLALAKQQIISDADCVAAAKGEWPSDLSGFLDLITPEQRRDVEIEWAAASQIERTDTNIMVLSSWLGLSDVETDALFGIPH